MSRTGSAIKRRRQCFSKRLFFFHPQRVQKRPRLDDRAFSEARKRQPFTDLSGRNPGQFGNGILQSKLLFLHLRYQPVIGHRAVFLPLEFLLQVGMFVLKLIE